MGQLQSFLPALFNAFGSQSADVRKVLAISFFWKIYLFFSFQILFFRDLSIILTIDMHFHDCRLSFSV